MDEPNENAIFCMGMAHPVARKLATTMIASLTREDTTMALANNRYNTD